MCSLDVRMVGKLGDVSAFAQQCGDGVGEGDQESIMFGGHDSGLAAKRAARKYHLTIAMLTGRLIVPHFVLRTVAGVCFSCNVCFEHLHK